MNQIDSAVAVKLVYNIRDTNGLEYNMPIVLHQLQHIIPEMKINLLGSGNKRMSSSNKLF